MDKLLPCPFCGGNPELYHDKGEGGYEPFWVVYCESCYARGPEQDKRDLAVAQWNRRQPSR